MSDRIVGAETNQGSFVKTLVGETGTGFQEGTHVHKDWWNKCLTYDQGFEQLQELEESREDIMTEVAEVEAVVNDDGQVALRFGDDREFVPTDHAMEQIGIKTNTSTYFLKSMRKPVTKNKMVKGIINEVVDFERDELDTEVLRVVINNALRRINDKTMRFRTYKDGTLRAFLSEDYAPIDNMWYVDQIKNLIPDGRLSHWRGDADTIYGNVLIPDSIIDYPDDDSDYGCMISVGNCEIGKRRFSQLPSTFRSICMNGCIWDKVVGKKYNRVHRGNIDYAQLTLSLTENINAQLGLKDNIVEKFLATRSNVVPKDVRMPQVFAALSGDLKMSKKQTLNSLEQWINHESNNRNMFGVINAVTRMGQTQDNAEWIKYDLAASKVASYSANKWDSLVSRSRNMTDDEAKKLFAAAV